MIPPGEDGGAALQWAANAILTLFTAVYGAILFRLWARLETVQDSVAKAGEVVLLREQERDRLMREELQRLFGMIQQERDRNGAAIDRVREVLEEDRKLASTDRANIAGTMVTRMELDRQLENRFGPAPRGRVGGDD